MRCIDNFLNSITMYRLVLYGLGSMAVIAIILAAFGMVSFDPLGLIVSACLLLLACYGFNYVLATLFKTPFNIESAAITALILFFIFAPPVTAADLGILVIVAFVAMLSKYLIAINGKHLFNPAAIAAIAIGLVGSGAAIWWVGSIAMLPVALIVGLLIVRKIRRFLMVTAFVATALVVMILVGVYTDQTLLVVLQQAFVSWPIIFFATVMLTEPLTTPPTIRTQLMYGGIVGLFFALPIHIGPVYATPEWALVIGNIFSYSVSSKQKLRLQLSEIKQLSSTIYEFIFKTSERLNFKPGQYLEWTLPQVFFESRGNRRYFTVASSPTEAELRLGVRISEEGSQFKKNLMALTARDIVIASQLAGQFTLPEDTNEKLVFIAGGIGITPFRSMAKYLIDTKERRDIILIYACLAAKDFVYTNVFKDAEAYGFKTVYLVTDATEVPADFHCETGYLTPELAHKLIPDLKERSYYLSGPDAMVRSYLRLFLGLGVSARRIKKDYFPGF